jgi:hypothetical protein
MDRDFMPYATGDRVWVADWEKGAPGGQLMGYGGGDPTQHTQGLLWLRGTVVNGDPRETVPGAPALVYGSYTIRLDRTSWYHLFRRTVSVPRYRLRKFSVLEQMADI